MHKHIHAAMFWAAVVINLCLVSGCFRSRVLFWEESTVIHKIPLEDGSYLLVNGGTWMTTGEKTTPKLKLE